MPSVGRAGFHGYEKVAVSEAKAQRTDISSGINELVDGLNT
ncbi:hypothetical protein [Streptomyces sp. NBC_01601]|nr:hypothetical protein [Streptomyces sp. NBC_01601]